jgi:hypothetical protein
MPSASPFLDVANLSNNAVGRVALEKRAKSQL